MGRPRTRRQPKSSSSPKTSTEPSRQTLLPWIQKPIVWVSTLFVTAAGASGVAWLQPRFIDMIDSATASADPVTVVQSVMPPGIQDMSFPADRKLSPEELEKLSSRAEAQTAWLEGQGAVPLGERQLTMALRSNRSHLVRVTGLRAVTECGEPSRGSLVRTVDIGLGGGAPTSHALTLDVANPGDGAQHFNEESSRWEPFFPAKTLTLNGSEEEFIVLTLIPHEEQRCLVKVELTVIDGEKEVRQLVPPIGRGVPIMPIQERTRPYPEVYLAGEICVRAVKAPPEYAPSMDESCGEGNSGRTTEAAARQ